MKRRFLDGDGAGVRIRITVVLSCLDTVTEGCRESGWR